MELIPFNCPCCGARLNVEARKELLRCEYCDSIVSRQYRHAESSQYRHAESSEKPPAQVARSLDDLLDVAYEKIGVADFNGAYEDIREILQIEPENAGAIMGKLLCVLKLSDIEKLSDVPIQPAAFPLYVQALQLASGKNRVQYQKINDKRRERIGEQRQGMEANIAALQQHLAPVRLRCNELLLQYRKADTARTVWLALLFAVPTSLFMILVVGLVYNFFLWWTLAVGAAFTPLAIVMVWVFSKKREPYLQERNKLVPLEAEVQRLQENYGQWLSCNRYVE